LGFKVVSAVQRISADIANDLEAELLEIPSGSPLLIGEQISYLGNDKPIETLKSVYRADRYDIVVNLNQEKEEKD
jgi:GntR family transcriptional regulator